MICNVCADASCIAASLTLLQCVHRIFGIETFQCLSIEAGHETAGRAETVRAERR